MTVLVAEGCGTLLDMDTLTSVFDAIWSTVARLHQDHRRPRMSSKSDSEAVALSLQCEHRALGVRASDDPTAARNLERALEDLAATSLYAQRRRVDEHRLRSEGRVLLDPPLSVLFAAPLAPINLSNRRLVLENIAYHGDPHRGPKE
jgi:hypothetical protein